MIPNPDGTRRAVPGGGPFNTARALARLGVSTAFLGRLSEDGFGRELSDLLVADGASLEFTSVGPEPTTVAVAEVDVHGAARYRFEVNGTSAPNLTPEMVPANLGREVRALHVGTLGLVFEPIASTLVELVQREGAGRLVMLDPNIRVGLYGDEEYRKRLASVMAHSTIVKASDSDLAWLFPGRTYEDAAEDILRRGPRMVVVTLGADGAWGTHGGCRLHVAAPPVEVVDTIGAGDVFAAGLLAWLHAHEMLRPDLALTESDIRASMGYACLAASLTCERAGADPPDKRQMLDAERRFGISLA